MTSLKGELVRGKGAVVGFLNGQVTLARKGPERREKKDETITRGTVCD